ncbi:MAG: hypothetical protein ACK41E_09290 [Deinococcales bacterium]
MYVLFLEFTLPELADQATLEALYHLERLFVGVAGVTNTRLLQNSEDQKVMLLEITSQADLLQAVQTSDLSLENVKTRVWGFEVLNTPNRLPRA